MSRQELDSKSKYRRTVLKGFTLLFCGVALFMFSCKSDIKKVSVFANELDLPTLSATNLEIEHTDSGKLQLKFITPTLTQFEGEEGEYYEFPDGVEVFFFDKNEDLESKITANYSIYHKKTQIWEARDSVVAQNIITGEKIETEELFWNQAEQFIYSKVFTKVSNENGVHYGEKGFEAAQDLTKLKLIGGSGTMIAEDEE